MVALLAGSLAALQGESGRASDCPDLPDTLYSDFNDDTYADVGIGVYSEDIGAEPNEEANAGAVNVVYGTNAGLATTDNEFWNQDTANVEDNAQENDWFGRFVASGNFNGDEYPDLAIGAYGEELGGSLGVGAVHILYGSGGGLVAPPGSTYEFFHQGSLSVGNGNDAGDHFGQALAAGDFDGDGIDDLAIGAPGEDDPSGADANDAGAVYVLDGSAQGLSTTALFFYQGQGLIEDSAELGDELGRGLAAGNFDNDAYDDLAIGAELEDKDASNDDSGSVNVLYGTASGLDDADNEFWTQDTEDVGDVAEDLDLFGRDLVTGDFDEDGIGDLAIGAKGEDLGGENQAGAVHVLYGTTANGLEGTGSQFLRQGDGTLSDSPENGDHLGRALGAGDFDGDGDDDLAIGVYSEDGGVNVHVGALHVLNGDPSTPLGTEDLFWIESDVGGTPQDGDELGKGFDAADYNGDGCQDLIIGIYHQDVQSQGDAGTAYTVHGSFSSGLDASTSTHWNQVDLEDAPEILDRFGWQFG